MKFLTLFFLLFILISCGGGNSNSDQILMPPQNVAPQPLFNDVPIKLDDAISIYGQACPDPSFQFLIPIKINADNFIDFIAHFWCDSDNPAAIDDKPTEDALVAYLSDGLGEYSIDNQSVFGIEVPKLGGASRKYSRGDINNDGKDDFAFAMNWEDGRAAFDRESTRTNYTEPTILLSNGDGYEVIRIGKPDWGHSVRVKDNKAFFAGHSAQTFQLNDSVWINVSEQFPELSFASFLIYDDFIINSVRKNDQQGLELIKNNQIISSLMTQEVFKVNFESWNNKGTGNYSELGVYNFDGENYFDGMTSEMCRQDDLIIATINASKLQEGEIIEGGFYSETDTVPIVMFAFYAIENEALVKKNIEIVGEEIEHNFNFFDCMDVNGDGQKDLVAQVFSQQWTEQDNNLGIPEIYIRNGDSFLNLDTTTWPTFTLDIDSQGYLYDVDSSGTHDLVMFPLKVNTSGAIEIYLSNRSITD